MISLSGMRLRLRAGLQQAAAELHLSGAGLMNRLVPWHQRPIDRIAALAPHLPHGMMPVGVAACAAEKIPIQRPAHIGCGRMPQIVRVERHGVIFVDRLAVNDRFGRRAVVVLASLGVPFGELGDVTVLPHVEVEPVVVVKPFGRAMAAGRMKRH